MNINFNLIKKHIEPKNILDIGAHHGEFNHYCRHWFPNSYILSIEGNKDCEQVLKNNNLNYLIYLLGECNKKTIFYKNSNNITCTGCSIYRELSYNDVIEEEVNIKTLDWVFGENKINTDFDFVKIDTQGSEIDILRGSRNSLKNTKCFLLEVSYKPYNQNAPLEDEVIKYMDEIGFVPVEELDGNPIIGQRDLLFIKK